MAELPEGTVFAGHRIDGIAGRGGMRVDLKIRLIFVVNRGSDDVTVIDRLDINNVEAGGEVDTVPVGERPKGVVVSDGVAWVTNTDDGSVSRIEGSAPQFTESRVRDVCDQPREIAAGS